MATALTQINENQMSHTQAMSAVKSRPVKHEDLPFKWYMSKLNELSHYFKQQTNLSFQICLDVDMSKMLLEMYPKSLLQKAFKTYVSMLCDSTNGKAKLIFISYSQVKASKSPLISASTQLEITKVNELLNYFFEYMRYNHKIE